MSGRSRHIGREEPVAAGGVSAPNGQPGKRPAGANGGGRHIGLDELRRRVLSWRTLLAFAIGALIIALLWWRFIDFEWDEFSGNLSDLSLRTYVGAAVVYYLSFWFRGIRWRSITGVAMRKGGDPEGAPPPSLVLAALTLAGWFLNSVMFLRIGDAYRGWGVATRSRLNFGGGLGTVFAERVQDFGLVLVLIVIAGVWALMVDGFAASGRLVDFGVGIAILGAAIVAALVVVLTTMRALGDRIAGWLPSRVRPHYVSFQTASLDTLRGRELPLEIVLGVLGWMCEVARFYLVAQALGLDMALSVAMFAALANAILSTAPIPGGFGLVETGLIGILLLTGVSDTDAFTLTVLDRAISWVSVVVLGSIPFVAFSLSRPRSNAPDDNASDDGRGGHVQPQTRTRA